MTSCSLPSFDTLADVHKYPSVKVSDYSQDTHGLEILPINDIELCNGRTDCRGCKNLIKNNTGKIVGIFLGNESSPSFALCERGNIPNMKRLINLRYSSILQTRKQSIVMLGSTGCPREFGEHPSN